MQIDYAVDGSLGQAPAHLDRVELRGSIESEGGVLPVGSCGTVVMVWDAASLGIEFTRPFPALVQVTCDEVRIIARA